MKQFIQIFFSVMIFAGFALGGIKAELVVKNAKIVTLDLQRPAATSLAVYDGKIIAIGDEKDTKEFIGTSTRVIDANGRLMIPGFNDAHVHFLETGQQLSSVDLRDAKTPQEFVERIKNFAAKLPKGRWILGGKWDHENWSPNDLPTAEMIDAATTDHPVFIDRLDGHMALANSAAMRLAKVDKTTKDVDGGEIVRKQDGEPTGIFKDAAMGYIARVVPAPSFEQKLDAARAATKHAASLGVTSVQDMSAGSDVNVYQELYRRGELNTRIYAVSPLPQWRRLAMTGISATLGDGMLRVGGLKGFADGSLGSTTAWFYKAYLDAPGQFGLASDEMPVMRNNVLGADKAGLQIMVHAIGDRANDEMLKIYADAQKNNGERDRRFRIEHAQHLNEDEIKRFAGQKVVASMQPFHIIDDGRWAWKRLDHERLKGTYAFRSILGAKGHLAFGSDSPVAPLNPLWGMYGAVTRRTLDDKNPDGWIPEQKISVEDALRAFTVGSAYAEYQDNVKGTLTVGKYADLVILSDDIFTIDPIKIWDVKPMFTIVGGRVVYEAN